MVHLEAACDATVDGKRFKKGEKLPSELSNFPLAKLVEDSKVKLEPEKKVVSVPEVKKIEVKKEEPKKAKRK